MTSACVGWKKTRENVFKVVKPANLVMTLSIKYILLLNKANSCWFPTMLYSLCVLRCNHVCTFLVQRIRHGQKWLHTVCGELVGDCQPVLIPRLSDTDALSRPLTYHPDAQGLGTLVKFRHMVRFRKRQVMFGFQTECKLQCGAWANDFFVSK